MEATKLHARSPREILPSEEKDVRCFSRQRESGTKVHNNLSPRDYELRRRTVRRVGSTTVYRSVVAPIVLPTSNLGNEPRGIDEQGGMRLYNNRHTNIVSYPHRLLAS